MHPRYQKLVRSKPNAHLERQRNFIAQHYLGVMGIQGLCEHSEYKMSSRDESDHDHHHRHEFYKPKRYVAASTAVARTVPGQELENKTQLATSANGEATAHFLRTCALVEQYNTCHFKHDDNSSLYISDLCCPLDHGFD